MLLPRAPVAIPRWLHQAVSTLFNMNERLRLQQRP
jgi:hypothetical protein